jgi:hypothetical protein
LTAALISESFEVQGDHVLNEPGQMLLIVRSDLDDASSYGWSADTRNLDGTADSDGIRQTAIKLQPVADHDREVGPKLNPLLGQIAHFTGRCFFSPTNGPASRDADAIQLPLWSHVTVPL